MVGVFTAGLVGQVVLAVSDMLRAVTSAQIGLPSDRLALSVGLKPN